MHAYHPTFRVAAVPGTTLRHRMILAMARRFKANAASRAPAHESRSQERFEGMDLDQRVREIGEW